VYDFSLAKLVIKKPTQNKGKKNRNYGQHLTQISKDCPQLAYMAGFYSEDTAGYLKFVNVQLCSFT